jgi:hypothetical protein
MCLLNVIVGSSIEKGQDKGKEEAGVSGYWCIDLRRFNCKNSNLTFLTKCQLIT